MLTLRIPIHPSDSVSPADTFAFQLFDISVRSLVNVNLLKLDLLSSLLAIYMLESQKKKDFENLQN